MQLNKLTVSCFRGIAEEITIEAEGENIGLVGPNGSGKSSVVEAIDFLLTGNIQNLSGEGSGSLSVVRHGTHVDASPEDAWVEGEFRVDGEPITLRRSMDDRRSLQPPPEERPEAVQQMLDAAERGLHLLSRDEILRFITARRKSRSEQLRTLLDLNHIQERRLELRSAKKRLSDDADRLEREYKSSQQRLFNSFDRDICSDEELLNAINDLRAMFDGEPLEELNPPFDRGLKSPSELVQVGPLRSKQTQELTDRLLHWFNDEIDSYFETDSKLRERIEAVRHDETAVRALENLQFIKKGREALDPAAEQCPLCLKDWNPDELNALLDAREAKATDLQEDRNGIAKLRNDALKTITDVRTACESLANILSQHETFDATKIDSFAETLSAWEEELEGELLASPPYDDLTDEGRKKLLMAGEVRSYVANLHKRANDRIPLDELEQAWETLHAAENYFEQAEEARQDAHIARRAAEQMETVYETYLDARDEVLEDIYTDIADRLEYYYTALNADERGIDPDFEPTETGLGLKVGFHGRGKHPPHALHSEGHQDSLGLCLHLALCDWLSDELPLVMLDDVVMSVDANHRRAFAELLADEISDEFQLVVTTHDDLWHNHLRSAGVVKSKNFNQFIDWSVHDGPQHPGRGGEWKRVEAKLEAGDVPGAAHTLRRTAEWFLREVCHNLEAEVPFKSDGEWNLGHFQNSAFNRYKSLLKKAKDAEQSWGNDIEHLNVLDEKRKEVFEAVSETQEALNPNVHYNEDETAWAHCTAEELRPTLEAYQELYDLFWCEGCGACISLIKDGHDEVGVKCRCGNHVNWNLQKA